MDNFDSSQDRIDRTLILLDCKEECERNCKPEVNIEFDSSTLSLQRSILSNCIEGIQDYCRILWDLYPTSMKLNVVSVHQKLVRHNLWERNFQNIQKVMENFNGINPSKSINIELAFEESVKYLSEKCLEEDSFFSKKSSSKFLTRLIFVMQNQKNFDPKEFTKYWNENSVVDISEILNNNIMKLNDSVSQDRLLIDHCELVILYLSNENVPNSSNLQYIPPKQISPFLTVSMYFVDPSSLVNAFRELAMKQFNLEVFKVEGIPMKQKETDSSSRGMYEVVMVFPKSDHFGFLPARDESFHSCLNLAENFTKRIRNQLTLRWKSVDRKIYPDNTLYCKCIHRITPINVVASPTVCLMKHLINESKSVILITVKDDMDTTSHSSITHALISHGEYVYLHCLRQNYFSSADFPISIYNESSVQNLRVQDFNERIINLNNLRMAQDPQKGHSVISLKDGTYSTKQLELQTRFFPYTTNETILFSNEQSKDLTFLIGTIKECFLKTNGSEMGEDDIETCIALIRKLHQCGIGNEVRIFPELADRPIARLETYKKLWGELHRFISVYATSARQKEIVSEMESLWPEACQRLIYRSMPTNKVKKSATPELQSPQSPSLPNSTPSVKTSSTRQFSAILYNEIFGKKENSSNPWTQADSARKEIEENQWKKADDSQRPAEELKKQDNMEIENNESEMDSTNNNGTTTDNPSTSSNTVGFKRKRDRLEMELSRVDKKSLFYLFWKQELESQKPLEFDGRKGQF